MFLARLVARLVMEVSVPARRRASQSQLSSGQIADLWRWLRNTKKQMDKSMRLRRLLTFGDVFDKRRGPPGDAADEGPRAPGQALVRQAKEVGHAVADAAHQAGRAAQDLQGAHHPT